MSDLFFVVVLITMIQGGAPVGHATGFFYVKEDRVYLVTNRHVVMDEAKGIRPNTLNLRLHTDVADLSKNIDRKIQLYDAAGKPRWHVHPSYATKPVDVAVVEVDPKAVAGAFFNAIGPANSFPEHFLIGPGEDVIVMGFPLGLSDAAHNLPLIRDALVSSAYGIPFNNEPKFLVDANLHPGMSGSPVMTKPKSIWPGKNGGMNVLGSSPIYFLGVFSATASAKDTASGHEEALGLGFVWYASTVDEIIGSMHE